MCLSNPKSSYRVGSDLGYTWGKCSIRENMFSSLLAMNLSQILTAALSFTLEAQSSPQHSFPLFSSTFRSFSLPHLSRLQIVMEFPICYCSSHSPFCYIPTNLITHQWLTSNLLIFHRPKQCAWPSPKPGRCREIGPTSKEGGHDSVSSVLQSTLGFSPRC